MTAKEFLDQVAEVLDMTEPLTRGQVLVDLPTYDSLGVLNVLGLYDSLGVQVTVEQLNEAKTTDDLIAMAGDKVS